MCALLTGHEHRSIEETFGNLLGDMPDSIGNLAAFAFLGLIMDQTKKKKKGEKGKYADTRGLHDTRHLKNDYPSIIT